MEISKTDTRLDVLERVKRGEVFGFSPIPSRSTWVDNEGLGLGRGLAHQVTQLHRLGLIKTRGNGVGRKAALTRDGWNTLRRWRKESKS